jgi:hypothetical protein
MFTPDAVREQFHDRFRTAMSDIDDEFRSPSALNTLLLVLVSAALGVSVLLDLGILLIFGMLFDAPSSNTALAPWLLVAMLLYPVIVIAGLVRVWRHGGRGAMWAALYLPMAATALVVGLLASIGLRCE